MSHIGIGGNLVQPNKQCLSCKYWKPAKQDYFLGYTVGGLCGAGYCKKNVVRYKDGCGNFISVRKNYK